MPRQQLRRKAARRQPFWTAERLMQEPRETILRAKTPTPRAHPDRKAQTGRYPRLRSRYKPRGIDSYGPADECLVLCPLPRGPLGWEQLEEVADFTDVLLPCAEGVVAWSPDPLESLWYRRGRISGQRTADTSLTTTGALLRAMHTAPVPVWLQDLLAERCPRKDGRGWRLTDAVSFEEVLRLQGGSPARDAGRFEDGNWRMLDYGSEGVGVPHPEYGLLPVHMVHGAANLMLGLVRVACHRCRGTNDGCPVCQHEPPSTDLSGFWNFGVPLVAPGGYEVITEESHVLRAT